MTPNPVLKKLGFSNDDRVAIIHTDDIGMCGAATAAAKDLWDARIITSSAVMVPCAWLPQTAAMCRANPKIDMGVHLTLTSEWDGYRWGPISTRDSKSGMLDAEGYFFRTTKDAVSHIDPNFARAELSAQIETAKRAGIDVTHIDTHMGSVMNPKLISIYFQLAMENKIPMMLPRDERTMNEWGFSGEMADFAKRTIAMIEGEGMPLIDHIDFMPLDQPEHRLEQIFSHLDTLKPGITHFIIHPSHDTPEARAICADLPSRVGDYETLMDERVRDHIKKIGVQTIGYGAFRELMR
jgi:predicted glycoside hydrolase/deacetylase ChbG (UPF0249 family)